MNRLVRILRNSRGWSELARYLEQRRQQPTTSRGWWLWPFCMFLLSVGTAMFVGAAFEGEVVVAVFSLAWLTGLTYMVWPARRVWLLHRAERRNR